MASVAPAQGLVGVRSQPRRIPLQGGEPSDPIAEGERLMAQIEAALNALMQQHRAGLITDEELADRSDQIHQGRVVPSEWNPETVDVAPGGEGAAEYLEWYNAIDDRVWEDRSNLSPAAIAWVESQGLGVEDLGEASDARVGGRSIPWEAELARWAVVVRRFGPEAMPASAGRDQTHAQRVEGEEDWRGSEAEAAAVEGLLPLERRILEIIIDEPSILVFDDPETRVDNIQAALHADRHLGDQFEGGRAGPLRRDVEQIVEAYYEGGYADVAPALEAEMADPHTDVESPEARRGPSLAEQYGTVPPRIPTREPGYNYAGPRSERPAEETDLDRIIRIAESQGLNVESVVAEYHAEQAEADYWAEIDAANVGQASASDREVRRWMEGRNLEEAPRWTSEAGSSPSYGTEGTAGERTQAAEGEGPMGIYPDPGFLPDVQAALRWAVQSGSLLPTDQSVTPDQVSARLDILNRLRSVADAHGDPPQRTNAIEELIGEVVLQTGADRMSVEAILNQVMNRYRMSIEEEWGEQTGAGERTQALEARGERPEARGGGGTDAEYEFLIDVRHALQFARDEPVFHPDPSVTPDQAALRDRILNSLYTRSRPGVEGGILGLDDIVEDVMRLTGAGRMNVEAILNQAVTRYRMSIDEDWAAQTGAEGSGRAVMTELERALRWAYEGAGDATRLGDVLGGDERFGPESHGDILDTVADTMSARLYGQGFDSIEEVAEVVADIYGNTDAAQVASEIQTLLADYHGEMELERLEAEQAGAIAGETPEQHAERIVGEATGGFFDLTAPSTEPAAEYTPAERLQAETDDRIVAEANAAERYGERMVRVSLDPANPEVGQWVPWDLFVHLVNEQAQIVINETGGIPSLEDIAGEIISAWDTEQGGMTVTSLQGEAQIMEALVALAEAEMFPDTIVTENTVTFRGVTYGERPTGEEDEGDEFPEGVHPAVTLYPPNVRDSMLPNVPPQVDFPGHTGGPPPTFPPPTHITPRSEPGEMDFQLPGYGETGWTPEMIYRAIGGYQGELPLGDRRDTSGPSLGLTPQQRQRALEAITGLRGTLEDPPPQGTLEPLPEDPLPEPGPSQGELFFNLLDEERMDADLLAEMQHPDYHMSDTEKLLYAGTAAAALLSGGSSLMGPPVARGVGAGVVGLAALFGGASTASAETPADASAAGPQSGRTDYTRMDTGAGIPATPYDKWTSTDRWDAFMAEGQTLTRDQETLIDNHIPLSNIRRTGKLTDAEVQFFIDNPPTSNDNNWIRSFAYQLELDELDWGDVGTFASNPIGEALKAVGAGFSDEARRRQEEPPFRFPWEN